MFLPRGYHDVTWVIEAVMNSNPCALEDHTLRPLEPYSTQSDVIAALEDEP